MGHRIVVCDDEPHITRAVSMKLTKAGFSVEACPDGQAAWEAVQRERPVLVVTDYQMPRLDGLELCGKLRSDASTEDLPVILLTAKGFELNDEQMRAEYRINKIVVKPFSPRELLKTVEELLGVTEPS